MKKRKKAYSAFINYTASGYGDGMTASATVTFYFFAESFGEAAVKAVEDFEAYRICQTKSPNSDYYGLCYEMNKVGIGEEI